MHAFRKSSQYYYPQLMIFTPFPLHLALQRQFLMYKKNEEENENLEIFNNFEPFLYKLVGTWAYSPHPKHWREFLDWFNSIDEYNFDPYVPGMLTSDWLHIHNSMGKRHMTWVCSIYK